MCVCKSVRHSKEGMHILSENVNRWAGHIHKHTHVSSQFSSHTDISSQCIHRPPLHEEGALPCTSYQFQSTELSTLIVKLKQMWVSWGRPCGVSGQLTTQVFYTVCVQRAYKSVYSSIHLSYCLASPIARLESRGWSWLLRVNKMRLLAVLSLLKKIHSPDSVVHNSVSMHTQKNKSLLELAMCFHTYHSILFV